MTSLKSGVKLVLMKKLSTYLFLVLFSFSALSFGDDIRDYQIEGMSIGDSLLDYYSENYIKNNFGKWYDDKFHQLLLDDEKYETYENVVVSFNPKDKKYLIVSISGSINYGKNINQCYKDQDKIDKIFSELFEFSERRINVLDKGSYGPENGDTNSKQIVYELNKGTAVIDCLDWDQKFKLDFNDRILISIDNKKFREWLIKNTQ